MLALESDRLRLVAAVSAMMLAVFAGPTPSAAQLVVFDPNNYAQNVLTAARALQQINNQIVSLQNQAQMLINQAKNLATLPFSSLLQLDLAGRSRQQEETDGWWKFPQSFFPWA